MGAEGVAPRFGLLESEINWAPSTELSVVGENLKPEGAMVARTFSKDNILVKNPPNLLMLLTTYPIARSILTNQTYQTGQTIKKEWECQYEQQIQSIGNRACDDATRFIDSSDHHSCSIKGWQLVLGS
jgi:hypothetical protein